MLARLEELATFGGQAGGGVTRVAFSSDEIAARDRVAEWMRDAGLDVRFDGFGNMFGSTDAGTATCTLPGPASAVGGNALGSAP